jgi:hypothetical protein
MSLQDLGSIGELIGAIATVATLIYLAVQVRQNSEQLRDSNRAAQLTSLDRTVEAFSRYRALLAKPENAELYARGIESYRGLDVADTVRFRAIMEEYFFAYSAMHQRTRHGAFENTQWGDQTPSNTLAILKTKGGAEWWADRKHLFSGDFASAVDQVAAEQLPADATNSTRNSTRKQES